MRDIKIKALSIIVAMFLIASAIVVFKENVEAAAGGNLIGSITAITINGETGDGNYASGAINISWTSSVHSNGVGKPVSYNVSFNRAGAGNGAGGWPTDGTGNASARGGNGTCYIWNTTVAGNDIEDGLWYVNVTATVTSGGELQWVNGSHSTINVCNNMPRTPGVDAFQGGNYTMSGFDDRDGGLVLSTTGGKVDYKVGSSYTINVNQSAGWGTLQYYLYYPIYNGSNFMNPSEYGVEWRRYSSDGIKLPSDTSMSVSFTDEHARAGIWVIDTASGVYSKSDADFSTLAQYNLTVPAWFWVNTSTDYTMDNVVDSFAYNATGSVPITVHDESSLQPTISSTGPKEPVVDIRCDANTTSIFGSNKATTTWTYSDFYRNNSYAGGSWPGTNGFWYVGNYTAHAYRDTDWYDSTVAALWGSRQDASEGVQTYGENNMDLSADGNQRYNATYGANATKEAAATWLSSASTYNWRLAGPWDPPEHNVTVQPIRVTTGDPYSAVAENYTVYYGFDGTVNITLLERSGGSAIDSTYMHVSVYDDDGINITTSFSVNPATWATPDPDCAGVIKVYKPTGKSGYILINMTKWGRNDSGDLATTNAISDNGTWKALIYVDGNNDRKLRGENKAYTEEWNETVKWKVKKAPKAQFKWIDDDGNSVTWPSGNKDNDGIIPYIPNASKAPLDVEFKVYDEVGYTFGDVSNGKASGTCRNMFECAENITITGDSLFTGKLRDFPGFASGALWYSGGVWHVPIIPLMSVGGGSITIKVTAYNTSCSGTLSIGGTNIETNGSVITVTPNEFKIDQENQTLSVTVKNAETGADNPYATVYLYYLDDTPTGSIDGVGAPIVGHLVAKTSTSSGGVYTIPFNTTQQTFNQTTGLNDVDGAGFSAIKAPRNLTIFVDGPGAHRDGYALVQMKAVDDLEVHLSHETLMAGYEYDGFTISCDFAGNSTDTPSTRAADKANFHIKIIDQSDKSDVTVTLLDEITATSQLTGSNAYSFSFDDVHAILSGTYSIYAYNNTHTSEGQNATLVVEPAHVTCDKSPFIWKADSNISATFTITYNGQPVNGSLIIDNMSDAGKYNKTWTNCSYCWPSGTNDQGGNSSKEIDETDITNGVVTINDITADTLHPNKAKQYITFWFKPSDSPGAYAKAKFKQGDTLLSCMSVEVPTIIPSPQYIPLGKTTKVYCDVTGRGTLLSDVFVRLHGCGFDKNGTSDVSGRVAFSISPASTGNISIDVGESGRTLANNVVFVTSWVLDVSVNVVEVNEGGQFAVTVMKEGTTTAVESATVTIAGIGTVTTNSEGVATFTAPKVTSDRTFTIEVTKEGYAPDASTVQVTVINIPGLAMVVTSDTMKDDKYVSPIKVTVYNDDTGALITGAQVTFTKGDGTSTVKSTANGEVTFEVTEEGTYTITATFGTFTDADAVTVTITPATPGFELLTLIAALGIAFILLRRRKK